MKHRRYFALALIIAVLLSMTPCSIAESTSPDPIQGRGGMMDYTKVRWYVRNDDQCETLNGESNQNEMLAVDALPGSMWTLSAEFVKVRDGQLLPYNGELDVTRHCEWTSDVLVLTGHTVTMPEAEGTYLLTGCFLDDEGNLYTCDFIFNVSEDNQYASSNQSNPLRSQPTITVEEKVQQLAEECREQGFNTQYEIALWLHDWLIYHANYDYNYENYNADGVLLKGTGVCDSYSKAFQLLLNEFNIPNQRVIGIEMNHAWNLVQIDGIWCHIDCTWDDPGTGGDENHAYFGMSAALIGRDHQWSGDYPSATSLDNYYPVREGMLCFTTESELDELVSEQARKQVSPITVAYIGVDADQNARDAVQTWLSANYWKYGMINYRMYGPNRYIKTIETEYTEPWEMPENHLETPVNAPDFSLDSPIGQYRLKNYGDNGIILIFGRTICSNTRSLLGKLSGHLADIYASGVDVVVSMYDASEPGDLEGIEADYPGFHYAFSSRLFWDYLSAVGYSTDHGVTFPCVFVINSLGKITYYSTGFVSSVTSLLNEAGTVTTGNPIPEPEKHPDIAEMLNGTGNVNDISDGESIVSAVQSASNSKHALLLISYSLNSAPMDYYENHYRLFDTLGIDMVVCCVNITDEEKAAYPHCTFVEYSNNDFWNLQYATDYPGGVQVSYTLNIFILRGGEIAAYSKGTTMNPNSCALLAVNQLDYDATVPASLQVIDDDVFSGTLFKRINLNNGNLGEIHSGAFAGCDRLELVRIPESVTTIEDGAFDDDGPIIVCTVGTAGYQYAWKNGLDFICE